MSTLAVNTITNAAGGNTAQINGMTPTADSLQGFRNRILNGGMVIDQRNAGASVSADNSFPVDRFKISISGSATATSQRSTVVPSGFTNSAIYTIGTGAAQGSSGVYRIFQVIEGFNTADLGWGASGASSVTLSFWVRSSVTGTFAGGLNESNGGTASYVFNYTISAANTWEYKTVTIAGPTIGTWQTGNSGSINVIFDLGSGTNFEQTAGSWTSSSNRFRSSGAAVLSATSGATFYITGVQLEAGSVATPFERRPYGTELALCQRYYFITAPSSIYMAGYAYSANSVDGVRQTYGLPVVMRATPTASTFGGNDGGSVATLQIIAATASSLALNLRSNNSDHFVWWAEGNLTASAEL
jgi:hypothetical protein